MKRFFVKFFVLIGIFIACLFLFSGILNPKDTVNTRGMAEPVLPTLSILYDGRSINTMCGYRQEVDEQSFRETLTYLPTDRKLTIELNSYNTEVFGINYQVTSLEDGSVVENGRVKSFQKEGTEQITDLTLDTPITMKQEYMLRLALDIGDDQPVYYYTRIVQVSGQNLSLYLDYVEMFYQNCLKKNLTDQMRYQLEPDSATANSSLHYVTLQSDQEQITWGNLEPELELKAVPTVLEINETTVSIALKYLIRAPGENDEWEHYQVSEFYRMRNKQNEVVLLNYERTTTQIIQNGTQMVTPTGLNLGITGKNVSYTANKAATIVAFVQAGEVWQYDREAEKVSKVFSFRQNGTFDERIENQDYTIALSSVTEEGDVTFMVYGHMPSGDHEGLLGICVYRYHANSNSTEEMLFVPVADSFQMLSKSTSKLAYVNTEDQCFICYKDTIFGIKLSDLTMSTLQETMDWNTFSASDSQTLVAWTENDENGHANVINELNLDTGEKTSLQAPEGDFLVSCGFVGEDIIYGIVHASDCSSDQTGNVYMPMYRLCIRTPQGELAKDYQIPGIYITSVERDDELLNLKRATMENGKLVATTDDQILHYEPNEGDDVSVKLKVTERRGTVVSLVFADEMTNTGVLTRYTRFSVNENSFLTFPDMGNDNGKYFIYAKGGLYAGANAINSAIITADAQVGVVLDAQQHYLWERGNVKTTQMLDISTVPTGLYKAPIDEESFSKAIGGDREVWNLTGCSLTAIQYQISNGYAVTAKYSDTENLLIIGYDQYNIWVFDGVGKDAKAIAFDEAQEAFEKEGNVFVSYR